MGVFARLLRRSKPTEEASTAEAQADTPTAEPAVEEAAAEAKGSAEAEERTEVEPVEPEAVEAASGDGVEIPKQQSAEEAADSEAGEDART
ncbi:MULTISPECIES: hypothetical protein [unclassified Streptomyces]|uniref:hypothetical protein n=1 Tax=unclassified Streptomyces TaxID=2593676 RepID=UPI00324D4493